MASHGVAVSAGPAARYAAALYAYGGDLDRLEPVVSNMERLGGIIDASADLRAVIGNPLTDAKTAQRAMRALVRGQELGIVVRRLIDVLIINRRLPLLRFVVASFAALVAEKRGIMTAQVTSAHDLSDVQVQQLRARLIELGYGNVRIARSVEADLLGGLIVRVGAKLYDSSLRSRLQRIEFAMKGAA